MLVVSHVPYSSLRVGSIFFFVNRVATLQRALGPSIISRKVKNNIDDI
jgi:hypothetical protein